MSLVSGFGRLPDTVLTGLYDSGCQGGAGVCQGGRWVQVQVVGRVYQGCTMVGTKAGLAQLGIPRPAWLS